MVAATCTDAEFIASFTADGAAATGKRYGLNERSVYARRSNLERKYGIPLTAPTKQPIKEYPQRASLKVVNGTVIIGSDFHIWPGPESTCLRAFKKFCKDIKPAAVILNGDVLDFPQISRHPPINWEKTPSPIEEIEAAQDHLHDIAMAAGKAHKYWTLGNHDARFEVRLATVASEYRGIKGIHLSDHFDGIWRKGYSCFINEGVEGGQTMVKHRLAGGKHAARNNVERAGVSIVTGHLHSQKVSPMSNYRPFDMYGVDTGCIADKDHPAFQYTEDSPLDWRSGFAILTFKEGRLLMPELVSKWSENEVQFRGALIRV